MAVQWAPGVLTAFFCRGPVADYAAAKNTDTRLFARFFKEMLCRGVYLPPSNFEAWFLSAAHSEREIQSTAGAIRESLAALAA
jgi:glutamate-1-semialdehyde 2,1-aminomutase